MSYNKALEFFKDNCNYEDPSERKIEFNFINGVVVLVETLQSDMRDIKSILQDLQARIILLESK